MLGKLVSFKRGTLASNAFLMLQRLGGLVLSAAKKTMA
ncbi:hypothetical protein AERO9A_420016 [Aeromonas salmonicida]|nr:hypothetical protein AERO9A_420016 [Aeromonas salmonicida]